jgi:hypothetical protein
LKAMSAAMSSARGHHGRPDTCSGAVMVSTHGAYD